MTEIIQKWIQDRLGILLSMSPEVFAETAKDGQLIAAILKSYEIITEEQQNMIQKSDSSDVRLSNFKDHILIWLGVMHINLDDEELLEIVNAKSTAALNLFYQLYLELHANSNLHFITQQRLREKLRPKGRFVVERVREGTKRSLADSKANIYDLPLREAKDIVHWQKDRMQMLQAKCKEAREQYLQYIRLNQTPKHVIPRTGSISFVDTPQREVVENMDATSINLSYNELVRQQDALNRLPKFVPDPQKSKAILKKFQVKQKEHSENLIFKTELQRDIFTALWDRLAKEEEDRFNKNITDTILKQSLYERQMHQKIGEVKLQKNFMLENKRLEAAATAKQIEDDFAQKLIIQEKELDAKELTYYLEKERVTELHKKLYEQKLRMRKQQGQRICGEVLEDLVKIACYEADYKKKVGEAPPRRLRDMWTKMFVNFIPLDDFITPTEIILKKPQDRPEDVEEIVHLEIDRQDKVDSRDMASYMAFEWPWSLDDIKLEERNLNDMVCGLNVLGNLVHNMLAVKYPIPPLPPKPDFPNVTVSACVNGVDNSCVPVLQQILNTRDILVVEMQDCINYCVDAYIKETTVEVKDTDPDLDDKKKKGKGKAKGKKDGGEKAGKKDKKGMKNKLKPSSADEEVVPQKTFADKIVQTPRYYPDEEIPLSHKAELGKVAQDVLESGEPLTNYILVAMFVEYLKSKPQITGWALINYPKTYEEAAVLEECLTGQPVPRETETLNACQSIFDMVDLEANPSEIKETDELEESRQSKILPQPVAPEEPEFYNTALTAYIKAIKKGGDQEKGEWHGSSQHRVTGAEDLADTSDPLDQFYADLGCNYHFYYNRIDFNSIKYLAKLIVGDYSLPPKTSVELFGEAINNIDTDQDVTAVEPAYFMKKGEKKQKPKEKKAKPKEGRVTGRESEIVERGNRSSIAKAGKGKKGKTKDAKSKVVIVHVDKHTQIPEVEEESEEEDAAVEPEVVIGPGEKGWSYISLPFSESLQTAIAKFWENIENTYVVDMEQVFFLKRLILNAVMPFVDSVKQHMTKFMVKPDEKQKYLRNFQRTYNEFEDDFRNDDDFKAEAHCRINEMREKLYEICDWKMIAAEHERTFIIEKNWTSRQIIQLVNNYITALQLELDRFVDTMLLIGDYYTAMTTKMPNNALIGKEILPKLEWEHADITKEINQKLQNMDDPEEEFLQRHVENIIEKCFGFVETNQNSAKSLMKKFKELFTEASKPKEKKEKGKNPPKDKKEGKGGKKNSSADSSLDEDVLKLSNEIMDEWGCAIRGEVVRVKVRLELLKVDLLRNLEEVLGTIQNTFHDIYNKIRQLHQKELESIDSVCKLLAFAVEKEVKIQEELVLDKEDFYVDPEVILFPDKLPPVRPLEESVRTGVFTINQLSTIADILMDLSPSGYMPERAFSYLLQDLIVSRDEPILLPELWRKLRPRQVDRVSKYLFDDVEYIQWKDFIIQNLMVPFPTQDEILELRKSFRALDPDCTELITDYQYLEIKFWFEPGVEDRYRLKLMRQLLFKLYRVRADKLNYTALLLDFCKDADAVAGLAKALTVSMGKAVCWKMEAGELFVEMSKRQKLYDELLIKRKKELEGGKEVVEEVLSQLMDHILDVCTKREEMSSEVERVDNIDGEELSQTNESNESSNTMDQHIKIQIDPVPDLAYFLPLEVVLTIITTCLPWHARVQNIEDKSFREIIEAIYEECKNSEFDYKVLSHEFLNHPMLIKQLDRTCKFSVKNPVLAVEDVLMENVEEKESKSKKH